VEAQLERSRVEAEAEERTRKEAAERRRREAERSRRDAEQAIREAEEQVKREVEERAKTKARAKKEAEAKERVSTEAMLLPGAVPDSPDADLRAPRIVIGQQRGRSSSGRLVLSRMSPFDVRCWLRMINVDMFSIYPRVDARYGSGDSGSKIDGKTLAGLTDEQLRSMGVELRLHRTKLLREVQQLQAYEDGEEGMELDEKMVYAYASESELQQAVQQQKSLHAELVLLLQTKNTAQTQLTKVRAASASRTRGGQAQSLELNGEEQHRHHEYLQRSREVAQWLSQHSSSPAKKIRPASALPRLMTSPMHQDQGREEDSEDSELYYIAKGHMPVDMDMI
jgi:hypothetical protein